MLTPTFDLEPFLLLCNHSNKTSLTYISSKENKCNLNANSNYVKNKFR